MAKLNVLSTDQHTGMGTHDAHKVKRCELAANKEKRCELAACMTARCTQG